MTNVNFFTSALAYEGAFAGSRQSHYSDEYVVRAVIRRTCQSWQLRSVGKQLPNQRKSAFLKPFIFCISRHIRDGYLLICFVVKITTYTGRKEWHSQAD